VGLSNQLQQGLESLCAAGPVEVMEDGELLAGLSPFQFEVREQGGRVLLHVWSAERNLARRVLAVGDSTAHSLAVEVQRFGRSRPGRLEFALTGRPRTAVRLTRAMFRTRFGHILAEQFPDEEIEALTSSPDLEHSFSGSYTRGLMRRGQRAWAVMAASPSESTATVDAMLSYALLWLDWNRRRPRRGTVAGLRLFLPARAGRLTAHRLQALDTSTAIELYELDLDARRVPRVDPQDIGNLETWLTPLREADETLAAAKADIERITSLAPEGIDATVPPGTREVSLRFRGVEFARWQNGMVEFGLGDHRKPLTSRNADQLSRLVARLRKYRHHGAARTGHELYRAHAERWLESMLLADATALDAALDPRFLYSQVPAFSAGDRGVIDLLGLTRSGRTVVVELKAQEDLSLALQAVDYWLRVRWHLERGDFERYGYFRGMKLAPHLPMLWLVAPGLRYHPATEVILRYLNPQIEVTRFGLNETWRAGLQVIFRQ